MFTDDKHTWFIVRDGRKLLCFAAVRRLSKAKHAKLTNDHVLPEYRDKDVHQKPLAQCIKWCKEQGIKLIKAECLKEHLPAYKKAGFKIAYPYVKWNKLEL